LRVLIFLLSLFPFFALAKNQPLPNDYFGVYCVSNYKNYYGTLSSEKEAARFLGKKVVIGKKLYQGLGTKLESPYYEIGVIDDWSKTSTVFHGLYEGRDKSIQLNIYPTEKKEENYRVEIISKHLLIATFDGYLYELTPSCN